MKLKNSDCLADTRCLVQNHTHTLKVKYRPKKDIKQNTELKSYPSYQDKEVSLNNGVHKTYSKKNPEMSDYMKTSNTP